MYFQTFLLALGLGSLPVSYAVNGKSYTGWDCCKPACAWKQSIPSTSQGSAGVCDINNKPLAVAAGQSAQSGCESGGKGFLCDAYSPTPVSDKLSYGFAIASNNAACCQCFQLEWTSGAAKGKQMIVQTINTFPVGNNLTAADLVLLTPGGGTGDTTAGCRSQYGTVWGANGGGVGSAKECDNLPQNLQGGCYWRYNWAKGSINTWGISYSRVSCPSRLTSISGCSG